MTRLSSAKIIVSILVGLIGIIVVLQNFQPVETNVLLWRLTLPHVVFLGMVFVTGCILGAVLTIIWYARPPKN